MTSFLRFLVIAMTLAFAAAACSPETSSDEPSDKQNNQNPDAGPKKDTSPDPGPCGTITREGECFGNTALWCDFGTELKSQSCTGNGGTGCKDGACRGIPFGFPCDKGRNMCAEGMVCRNNTCTYDETTELHISIQGEGTVTSPSSEMYCPLEKNCIIRTSGSTEVILNAEPAPGSKFVSWSHGCSGYTDTTSVRLVGGKIQTCHATFARNSITIDISVHGEGGKIQIDPLDILCADRCEAALENNQVITLTAIPDPGFALFLWRGCYPSTTISLNSISFTATGDHVCGASFYRTDELTVEVVGRGRVKTKAPVNIDCSGKCTTHINPTSTVQFDAFPSLNARFVRWEGHCSGTHPTTQLVKFSPPGPYLCRAIFEDSPTHPLTITVIGDGTVKSNPAGIDCAANTSCTSSFHDNNRVILTATPNPGSRFFGWKPLQNTPSSNNCWAGDNQTTDFYIKDALHCQAEFVPFYTATESWKHAAPSLNPTSTQWHPDGTRIGVYNKNFLRLFDADSRDFIAEIRGFSGNDSGRLFAWNPQGTKIASTYTNSLPGLISSQIRVHNIAQDRNEPAISLPTPLEFLTWNPDGTLIAAGAHNGSIYIVNPTTRAIIHNWAAHNSPVSSLSWSPNGDFLASSSLSEGTRIWSTETWTLEHDFSAPGWDSLDWNHNSTQITGFSDDHIHLVSIDAGPDNTQPTSWPAINCKSVSFNPTGTRLVAACDSQWAIWNVADQTLLYTAPPIGTTTVQTAQWNPLHNKILVQYDDGTVRTFNSENHKLLLVLKGANNAINTLVHNPFTNALYAASRDGFLIGLDATTGNLHLDFNIPQQTQNINSIAFSRTEKTLLGASDGYIHAWSTTTSNPATPWSAGAQITQIGLSHNNILATSLTGNDGIRLWPTPGQPHTQTLTSTHTSPHIAWQPGGHLLASTAENTTHLWNTQTGLIQHTLDCPPNHIARTSTFRIDGRRIAVACVLLNGRSTLTIWNVASGELLHSFLSAHFLDHLAWHPNSQIIAAASDSNRIIQFYDASTGNALLTEPIKAKFTFISFITWHPNGRQLFVGFTDGKITAYDVTP